MAQFFPQGLLLLVLSIVISECSDVSPVIEPVHGFQGDDVALPCFISNVTDPKGCLRVKLVKYATDATQMKVIFAWPKTSKYPDAKHVKWQTDGNGPMQLFLTTLQKSDEGLYGCEFWRGWDVLFKNISLKVKDCKTSEPVKAVPSTPVYLNCPVDTMSGQPGPQNVSWVKLKGSNPVAVNSKRVEMNGTSLAIQSVTNTDSGWYRCNYMLGQTQCCFDINLLVGLQEEHVVVVATVVPALTTSEVIQKTMQEGSSRALGKVVASVITGTVAMAALIGLFVYRRHTRVQRHPAGTLAESIDGYEIVGLRSTLFHDPANSLCNQQSQDDSLCTFHY